MSPVSDTRGLAHNTADLSGRLGHALARHWLVLVTSFLVVLNGTPFLAPVFMHLGWSGLARVVYTVYIPLCHQLPQRSWFVFGPSVSYSLPQIQQVAPNPTDVWNLHFFYGTPAMGWKVAWSDRMVSLYGGLLVASIVWAYLRHRKWVPHVSWLGLAILLLPLVLDGTSHMFNDMLAGLSGTGFRDTNAWLAILTGHAFAAAFYQGDAVGSFNAWMRLVTGLVAAFGMVFVAYPYFDRVFKEVIPLTNATTVPAVGRLR